MLCGTMFENLFNKAAETRTATIKIEVVCPGCGKKFEVEKEIKQKGTKLDFDSTPISELCPWPK